MEPRNLYFSKAVQEIPCVVRLGTLDVLISKAPSRFNTPDCNYTALNSAHTPVPCTHCRGRACRAKAVLIDITTLLPFVGGVPAHMSYVPQPSLFCCQDFVCSLMESKDKGRKEENKECKEKEEELEGR